MAEAVLVTGGSGFIGGWCIVELLRRGYDVRTTVRSLTKAPAVEAAIASAVGISELGGERLTFFVADLTKDDAWDTAVTGCDYVLHVASPLGADAPKDPNTLIVPARDGTLRVLKAATKAGVKRVVVTSSAAAAASPPWSTESLNNEAVWTDPTAKGLNAYRQSKTLAERAAWHFMAQHAGPTTLTTILPSAVFGPILTAEGLGSVQVIQRMLSGKFPGNPRIGFSIVDVRDVADMHIRAMTAPEAAGERFLASGDFLWAAEISALLRAKLGDRAKKVPTRSLPDFVLRIASIFDPAVRLVTPSLGRKHRFTTAKAERVLGWHGRSAAETVIDCAESLIAAGAV
ncbi:SDR family oxidoreductase [Rhizobium jaguaris]|uniref:Aldehyde reductase n=1 Tax=Rhizobium jaguaris TaxID=1312183 RepID=A0A387FFH4_9HYPH|nr:aldehyde reductase [Rhizobium jaguaris]AYG57950.1 aldehyde reductase [Rhizobium jaguaris]